MNQEKAGNNILWTEIVYTVQSLQVLQEDREHHYPELHDLFRKFDSSERLTL